jgi:hypothetical protein
MRHGRRDPHDDPPRRSSRSWTGDRVPTLGEMQRTPGGWVWVYCEGQGCRHHAAMAVASLVIRWGPETSSDKLRRCARCTACGRKGATLRRASWTDNLLGWQPFPVDQMVRL